MVVRLVVVACGVLALAGGAAAHEGIPRTWWLDEASAVRRLQVVEPRWVSGVCTGLAPRATRNGAAIYKHFLCRGRIRAAQLTIPGSYRVHVTGPRGRVVLGP